MRLTRRELLVRRWGSPAEKRSYLRRAGWVGSANSWWPPGYDRAAGFPDDVPREDRFNATLALAFRVEFARWFDRSATARAEPLSIRGAIEELGTRPPDKSHT